MSRGKGNRKSHKQRKQERSEPVQSNERPTDSNSTNETAITKIDSDANTILKVDLESQNIDHEKYIAQCNSLSERLKNLQIEINKRAAISLKKDGCTKLESGQVEQAKISLEKLLNIEKNEENETKMKELETLIRAKNVNVVEAERLKELGNISYKKKDFDAALNYYDQAIKLNGDNMIYFNNKGAVYFQQMDYDKCVEQCDKAIEVGTATNAENKHIAKAMNRMALSYIRMHKYNEGACMYNKSLRVFHSQEIVEDLDKLRQLETYRFINDRLMSDKLMKDVYKFSDSSPGLNATAKKYMKKGYDEMLEENNKFDAGLKTMNDPNGFLGQAILNLRYGHYERSIELYTKVMTANPDKAIMYRRRGEAYLQWGKFKEALKDLDKYIMRRPNRFEPYVVKAGCLVQAGRYKEAAEVFKVAAKLDSKTRSILGGLIPKLEQGIAPSVTDRTKFVQLGHHLNTTDDLWE